MHKNLALYSDSMIIAADFEEVSVFGTELTQLTATYNSIPLHARPLAQNYISNTLLRHLQTQAGAGDLGTITVSTHPLPDPKTVSCLDVYMRFLIHILSPGTV